MIRRDETGRILHGKAENLTDTQWVKVFIDGVECTDAFEANAEEGWVDRYVPGVEAPHWSIRPDDWEYPVHRVYGAVEMRDVTPHPDELADLLQGHAAAESYKRVAKRHQKVLRNLATGNDG